MKKKLVTLLLAASMAVTSLAGCGQAATNNTQESTEKESGTTRESVDSEEETEIFNAEGYPIVNEEITLNVLLGIRDSDNIVAPDEMPAIQRLEELTGINLEWEVVKTADWSTRLNLMFTSGEYPDLIISNQNTVDYEEYGVSQEILIPLDDLIAEYMPTYNERLAMAENDPTVALIASDGQQYALPYLNNNTEYLINKFNINQEWLDALDLEMPTNIESLTDVLRAFKTGDPNGNGQQDEIPLIAGINVSTFSVQYFAQLFGVPYNQDCWLYIDDNKQVQFTPWQDGFRECMEWLHMCYDEELLDVEVLSQDQTTLTTKFNNGLGGFASFYNPLSLIVRDQAEKFSLYVQDEGAKYSWKYTMAKPGVYLTATNEYPEATMRLIDAMLEKETMWNNYAGDPDRSYAGWKYNDAGLIENFTVEGEEVPAVKDYLGVCAPFFAPGEYYSQNFAVTIGRAAINASDAAYKATGDCTKYSHIHLNLVKFDSEQNAEKALIETEINNAVDEHMALFIKDGVTDESWNEFVEILKNVKAEEYVKMYQDGIDAMDIE